MNKLDKARVATLVMGLFSLRRDHGHPEIVDPGGFPHTPDEYVAYAYCDAIRDAFLALKMAKMIIEYYPGSGYALMPDGTKTRPIPQPQYKGKS